MPVFNPSASAVEGIGTATLDFGAFPGASDASVSVTGQTLIGASAIVHAWLFPAVTADHSVDEHCIETLDVRAGMVSAGVGFTICGSNKSQTNEPLSQARIGGPLVGGTGTRIYGTWNVGWYWRNP